MKRKGFEVAGYAFRRGIPEEDYFDFPVGMRINSEELQAGVRLGVYPPGLRIWHGGDAFEVVGGYGQRRQRLKRLVRKLDDGRGEISSRCSGKVE